MKKWMVLSAVLFMVATAGSALMAARLWHETAMKDGSGASFNCGEEPGIALLYGVQPVVSGGTTVVHQTAFGWEYYPLSLYNPYTHLAGDGARNIVSNGLPVGYGRDGEFYSSTTPTSSFRPTSLSGGLGPTWIYAGSGPYASVNADASGVVYAAFGDSLARVQGDAWSSRVDLSAFGINYAFDLAISPFGDIAVVGGDSFGGPGSVAWFDYKYGWRSRALYAYSGSGMIDAEWDQNGNLGVAYADEFAGTVSFDYLDVSGDTWTTETVNSTPSAFTGAALAYDRFGNPVIASGTYLYYDPIVVPEPTSWMCLAFAVAGTLLRRRASKR